ncbi:MAG TPA: hypothetical protein VJM50_17825 [Pyrinomonadaceae bacterium]|nr:hypothetical protein [Pyrinomonadaceae bacterium]
MINDSMTQCRYCSVPVDPAIAKLIADRQEKANQAYSDGSFLRTAAIAMYVFLGLSWAPVLPFIFFFGLLITFFTVLILLIRWQVRYATLVSDDPDFKSARRSWWISLALLIGIPVIFIVRVAIEVLIRLSRGELGN